MTRTDPEVEAFFAALTVRREEMAALRAILLDCGLVEAFKWRAPVYTVDGGNVAILWGFSDHCALGFFKGVLLDDPEGLLVAPGENSRSARKIVAGSVAEIAAMAPTLRRYVEAAMAVERAGLKVALPKDDLDMPEELSARMEGDPDFAAAFRGLTPGRRRGWILHFSQPKQGKTRTARIDRAAPRILAGKGMHDR